MSTLLLVLVAMGAAPEVQNSPYEAAKNAPQQTVSQNDTATNSKTAKSATVKKTVVLRSAEMKQKIRAALKQEAKTSREKFQGDEHTCAVVQLLNVFQEVQKNTKMTAAEQKSWAAYVQARLDNVKRRLKLAEKKAKRNAPKNLNPKVKVLAQIPGFGQNNNVEKKPVDGGQSLVELIENTVAPESWEANGGEGKIMYYPLLRVIVVYNSDGVHGQMGNLVEQLRNAN